LRYRPKVHGDFIVQCVRLIVMIVHTTVLRQIAYAALGRRTLFIGRSSDDLSLLVWWLISQNLFFSVPSCENGYMLHCCIRCIVFHPDPRGMG